MSEQTAQQTAEIIDLDLNRWHKKLEEARGKGVESIIAFGVVCFDFQTHAVKTQGGSVYSEKMKEWYGMKHSAASRWAIIGENKNKLVRLTHKLPPDWYSIYLLCEIPEPVIQNNVTPKTTQKQVRILAKQHKPKKVPKAKKPKAYRESRNKLISEHLGGGYTGGRSAANLAKKYPEKFKNFPQHFTNETEALEFVAWFKKEFPEQQQKPSREELTKTQQKKYDRAIEVEFRRLNSRFEAEVKTRVEKLVVERQTSYKHAQERAEEREAQAKAALARVERFMTENEYKLLLNCVHPDRAPTGYEKKYTECFQIVRRLEAHVNPHCSKADLKKYGWLKG